MFNAAQARALTLELDSQANVLLEEIAKDVRAQASRGLSSVVTFVDGTYRATTRAGFSTEKVKPTDLMNRVREKLIAHGYEVDYEIQQLPNRRSDDDDSYYHCMKLSW